MNDRNQEERTDVQKAGVTITRSNTIPYAFTLRKVGKKASDIYGQYAAKLGDLNDLGISTPHNCFEHKGGVHMHGIMQVPRGFNFKRLRCRGWNIKCDQLYDLAGWQAYLAKEQILREPEDTEPDPDFKMPTVRLFI